MYHPIPHQSCKIMLLSFLFTIHLIIFSTAYPGEQILAEKSETTENNAVTTCICLEEFADDLRVPILAVHANDSTGRLFIAEQIGLVHIYLNNKTKLTTPFLDIQSKVLVDHNHEADERGLLGLAFNPDHLLNGKLYVYYYTLNQDNSKIRISEFETFSDDLNRVDPSTESVILEIEQPDRYHNGGQLLFGTDGYLYAFLGDGGGTGDQHGEIGSGQNL